MELLIVVCVWGSWHLEVFKKKALASILHPSNLPAMDIKWRFIFYTNEQERGALLEPSEAISRIAPCEIRVEPLSIGYKSAWQHACAHTACENLVMFCAPDIVWSAGSFPYLARKIKEGKRLIFMPHPRITDTAIDDQIKTGEELMRLCEKDAHPVNKSEEAGSWNFTRHPEVVLWPIRGAWIARMFAREPLICEPSMKFNGHNLPAAMIEEKLMDVVSSSDDACGISLSPRDKERDHYKGSTLNLKVERLHEFTQAHHSSVGEQLASLPCLLRYGDINHQEKQVVIEESDIFVDKVFAWAHERPACPIKKSARAFK